MRTGTGRERLASPWDLAGILSSIVHISCNPPEIKGSQRVQFPKFTTESPMPRPPASPLMACHGQPVTACPLRDPNQTSAGVQQEADAGLPAWRPAGSWAPGCWKGLCHSGTLAGADPFLPATWLCTRPGLQGHLGLLCYSGCASGRQAWACSGGEQDRQAQGKGATLQQAEPTLEQESKLRAHGHPRFWPCSPKQCRARSVARLACLLLSPEPADVGFPQASSWLASQVTRDHNRSDQNLTPAKSEQELCGAHESRCGDSCP